MGESRAIRRTIISRILFMRRFGFTTTGGTAGNYTSFKAQNYAITFYTNTNDVRLGYDYSPLAGYGVTPYEYLGGPFGTIGLPSPSSASSIGAYIPASGGVPAGPQVGLLQDDASALSDHDGYGKPFFAGGGG
jgi:hypothetical protein